MKSAKAMALTLYSPLVRAGQLGLAMSGKTFIVFVLAPGIVAAALVFDAVSHRRTAKSGQAVLQNLETTHPAATAPAEAAAAAAAQPVVVPAGTTLTVRLGEKLGSKISRVGQSFSATLDQDVVVDGHAVIAAGTTVNGEVAFARAGGAMVAQPNLQLKLTSVSVNNEDLALATSTRSFGPTIKGKGKVGRFMKSLLRHGKVGCQLTSSSELCGDLVGKAAGKKDKEVLLADQSAYAFTLRQPLQIW